MRSRYRVSTPDSAHFITSTTVSWIPVFTTAARCDILVAAFEHCRQNKGLQVHAWVILDNHFHAIVSAPDLARIVADFKRHTARQVLQSLEAEGCDWLVNQLKYFCAAHKTESQHQLWQEGFHPQAIITDEMMLQKLEYLHNNPVKRGLVAAPEDWRYSSAHEWREGAMPVLRCDPWR